MKFEFEKKGRLLIVKITGELDHHSAASLREETDREILGGSYNGLILDLSGLDMMDSSGIGLIMGRSKLMKECGGRLEVLNPQPYIRRVLRLAGIERIVKIR